MNEIEKVIKFYVKKHLKEAFANLDEIVENKVQDVLTKRKFLLQENVVKSPSKISQKPSIPPPDKKIVEQKILDRLGVEDGIWKDIFLDTLNSPNLVLSLDNKLEAAAPEGVPVEALEQMGILRDYSKFLPNNSRRQSQPQIIEEGIDNPVDNYDKFQETLKKIRSGQ